jgi:methyltransferase (TIGR00027 family)
MKANEPSRTALLIARQRAAHQVLDHGSILHDPFAMKILGEDEKDVLQFANAHPLASIGRLFTAARSRIAEDALSGAVERGIRQIVILGAGLDTFALRCLHGARQIRIYEVDHPATQASKRQRLAEAQLAVPPSLVFVPVDLEQDDLGEALVGAGFQQNSPAFFTWLGVVPYLTEDAIGSTLDYIASIQNSEVVFDYMEPPHAFSEEMGEYLRSGPNSLRRRMSLAPPGSSRPALQRFFARTDFLRSKASVSRRSRRGSAAPFKSSRPERLVFMLSTLSASEVARRTRRGLSFSADHDVKISEASLFLSFLVQARAYQASF